MRNPLPAHLPAIALLLWAGMASAQASSVHRAQSDMPVIPPPSQRAPTQAPSPRSVSIDELARMGYDVRAIERAGQAEGRYVVMMQRAGDVKTCLMRIEVQRGQQPQRQSACF